MTEADMATIRGNDMDNYSGFWGLGLVGTEYDDYIYGYGGDDDLLGNGGDDWLDGGTGEDYMEGGSGDDTYIVDNARDLVAETPAWGNSGYDTVRSSINYVLPAEVEKLVLTANVENLDLLGDGNGTGNALANHINGSAQNNIINGRGGADVLRGGGGQDQFVFDTALGKGNVDTLADLNVADDTILLDNAVFTGLPAADLRVLSAAELRVGSAAMDSTDRIIYNWNTGAVLYDPDGIGAQAAVQLASIGAGQNVTSYDFVIM